MWWVTLIALCPFMALGWLARSAWLESRAHSDPLETIRAMMHREAQQDMRQAMKQARRSRKRGTMDDLVWCRELEDKRS